MGVDNRVGERLQQTQRRSKVGPVDHALVLIAQALEVTKAAYLEMIEMVLDQNPEVAFIVWEIAIR